MADQYLNAMHDWLSPLFEDFNSKQQETYNTQARQDALAKRILEGNVYREWLNESGSTLWCLGTRGIGKTVIASVTINSLQQHFYQRAPIIFIYCDYRESGHHTVSNFLGVILQQLLVQGIDVFEDVKPIYEAHRRARTKMTLEECSKLLQQAFDHVSRVFLVCDGLDECLPDVRDRMFAILGKLQPKPNVLITSRYKVDTCSVENQSSTLELHADPDDIKNYVEARIRDSGMLQKHIKKVPKLHQDITELVSHGANGM